MRIYLRKAHHIQDPEVNSIWNGPKVDGKLNISSSTYSCGVALSSKEVIFEIHRNHSRLQKVARLRVTRRSDPMCKASINGIWLMDRSRMWVNLCVNYSQFTQSTSAKFKVEFDDLIRGLQLCVCRLITAMSVDPCRSISCFGSWPRHELLKKIFLDLLAVNTLGYSSSTSLSPSHSFIVCPCEDLDN